MNAVRAAALAGVLGAVLSAGVLGMADAMKFQTDSGDSGSRTTITFDAHARDTAPREDPALALWKACRSHVDHVRVTAGPVEHDGIWTVTVEPALGTHTERRLVGCLKDLTADGITGSVLDVDRIDEIPAESDT